MAYVDPHWARRYSMLLGHLWEVNKERRDQEIDAKQVKNKRK